MPKTVRIYLCGVATDASDASATGGARAGTWAGVELDTLREAFGAEWNPIFLQSAGTPFATADQAMGCIGERIAACDIFVVDARDKKRGALIGGEMMHALHLRRPIIVVAELGGIARGNLFYQGLKHAYVLDYRGFVEYVKAEYAKEEPFPQVKGPEILSTVPPTPTPLVAAEPVVESSRVFPWLVLGGFGAIVFSALSRAGRTELPRLFPGIFGKSS